MSLKQLGFAVSAALATVTLSFVLVSAPALAANTSEPQQTPRQEADDCWYQFMDATGPRITCTMPAVMEDKDREEIRKLTREVLTDARCDVAIELDRTLVETAVRTPDTVFTAPPQPVTCQIVTSRGTLPVAFTFAPRIEIKAGEAIKATPGMANVTGVNSWLAWPVVAYVNASGSIQDVMLRVVNAYLKRRHEQAAQKG